MATAKSPKEYAIRIYHKLCGIVCGILVPQGSTLLPHIFGLPLKHDMLSIHLRQQLQCITTTLHVLGLGETCPKKAAFTEQV